MCYVLLLGMVDTIFADVAQPDQARIVAINAHHFLRNEGHVVISIKVGFTICSVCILYNVQLEMCFSSEFVIFWLLDHLCFLPDVRLES